MANKLEGCKKELQLLNRLTVRPYLNDPIKDQYSRKQSLNSVLNITDHKKWLFYVLVNFRTPAIWFLFRIFHLASWQFFFFWSRMVIRDHRFQGKKKCSFEFWCDALHTKLFDNNWHSLIFRWRSTVFGYGFHQAVPVSNHNIRDHPTNLSLSLTVYICYAERRRLGQILVSGFLLRVCVHLLCYR